MSIYRTEKFKQLKKEWYDKLKAEDFPEIEDVNSPRELLKTWHNTRFIHKMFAPSFQSQKQYYQTASNFLNQHPFENEHEKEIWQLHTSGQPVRAIANSLNRKAWKIHQIIMKLRRIMLNVNAKQESLSASAITETVTKTLSIQHG